MPSWNIHTAHVERLLEGRDPEDLGIADVNAFLFGNYTPDIYVGFMVPDASFHVDYCLTHYAEVRMIPVPDADRFWDNNVYSRRLSTAAGDSLTLGAWAHLTTDRVYNARFRGFCKTHEVPMGEKLRKCKQSDFDAFGHSLSISSYVQITQELLEAARSFRSYSVQADDVAKAVDVANAIVRDNAGAGAGQGAYKLLSLEWLTGVFDECNAWLVAWLEAWQRLEQRGICASAQEVRAEMQTSDPAGMQGTFLS